MSTLSPSPLPTLLRLPTETLDRILSFSLPPGAKAQRLALNKLLSVHPLLSALVRRRLYRKLSCLVGDPKKRDERVLNFLDGGGGGEDEKREGYGHLVRFLKIRRPRADPPSAAPLAPPPEFDFVGDPLDPAATLLPRPRVSQAETMRVFVRLAEAVKGVKHVEWDLRGGTVFEGQEEDAEGEMVSFGGRDQLDRLEGALKKWRAVDTFLYAVEDASQRQQVLSTPTWSSPLLNAMMEWETLTYLDLWRVKVVLPPSTPQPKFRLKELRLTQSTLGGEKELEFFLGAPSSTSEGQRRAANLEFLFLTDVDFLSYPSAATKPDDAPSPLLTLFRCDSPFVSQLRNLDLTTRLPLGPPGSTDGLLSGLTALETVELGGPGIDEGVFASLFLSAATGAAPPAKTLKHLTLTYLTHPTLPLPTILSYLSPLPFPTSTHSHTVRPQPPLSLLSLRFNTGFPLPRPLALSLPYRERRLIHDPVWEPLSAFGPTRDVDGEEEAWDAIERACRGLNREKRRVAIADSGEGKWDPVKLHKNHSEVQYDALNSPASSSDDEEDSDADSDDSDARSREMNALFVPDEEDIEEIEREEGREWQESVREAVRREQEEEEEDGFN